MPELPCGISVGARTASGHVQGVTDDSLAVSSVPRQSVSSRALFLKFSIPRISRFSDRGESGNVSFSISPVSEGTSMIAKPEASDSI